LNDLKQFVFDIAKGGDSTQHSFESRDIPNTVPSFIPPSSNQPIILGAGAEQRPVIMHEKPDYHSHETIDENLSLLDKERELIIKALKKHRNKRRDAAEDLGISERTLYRKIKEYRLDE
jgi:DNA-binding NtrC family response regulator